MITIKDFMETINYKITEGSEYLWQCFGPNCYRLDSWSGALNDHKDDDYTISVLFDTENQIVYQIEAHDYKNNRSYRWTNPGFQEEFKKEVQEKLQDKDRDFAYDNVKFTELEVEEDFLKKAKAIVEGKNYDTRVSVPIELDDDELFRLMKSAHEQDITLNQLVENILSKVIEVEHASRI